MNDRSERVRLRLRYTKHGKVRFISHRDLARVYERAFRKLRLPVAYSEGFSPRPKISFGLALSVGHESDAEYLDVELATSVDLEAFPERLSAVLPPGLRVTAVTTLEPGAPSLQEAITSCGWLIEVLGASDDDVAAAAQRLRDAETLPFTRQRKGKTSEVDVRPCLLDLEVRGPTDRGVQLRAELATTTVTVRPAELVELLSAHVGRPLAEGAVCRTHQWTTADDCRGEPIGLPTTPAPHELRRAS